MWEALLPILLILSCDGQPKGDDKLAAMLKLIHESNDKEALNYLNNLVNEVIKNNASNIINNNIPNDTFHLVNKTRQILTQNGNNTLKTVLQNDIEITKNISSDNITTITTDLFTKSEFVFNNTDPIAVVNVPVNNNDGENNAKHGNIIMQVPIYIDMKGIINKIAPENQNANKNIKESVFETQTMKIEPEYEDTAFIVKITSDENTADKKPYNYNNLYENNEEIDNENLFSNEIGYIRLLSAFPKATDDNNHVYYNPNVIDKSKSQKRFKSYDEFSNNNKLDYQESLPPLDYYKKDDQLMNHKSDKINAFSDNNLAYLIKTLLEKSRQKYQQN